MLSTTRSIPTNTSNEHRVRRVFLGRTFAQEFCILFLDERVIRVLGRGRCSRRLHFPLAKASIWLLHWIAMDPKHDAAGMYCAPHAQGAIDSSLSLSRLPTQTERRAPAVFPRVDDHIVEPETYEEIIRGRRVSTMTALHPHAEAQSRLAFLLRPHVKPGWEALTELLTRAAFDSDFGTDVCVCRQGKDPATGGRYLEELSFEVVNEQRMRDILEKAEDLSNRGVRRVFAIFVKKGEVCEWSQADGKFVAMKTPEVLDDPLFIRPIPVKAIMDAAASENEVAKALILKGNSAIVEFKQDLQQKSIDEGRKLGIDEGRKLGIDEGKLQGRRETFLEQLGDRFGDVPRDIEALVCNANVEKLRHWSKKLGSATILSDVFGTGTEN